MKTKTLFTLLLVVSTLFGFTQDLDPSQNRDGKWGFINKQGEVIIPFVYDEVGPFADNNLAAVYLKNYHNDRSGIYGYWAYINKNGDRVIDSKYEEAERFVKGVAKVKLSGKWSYINSKGESVTPVKYNWIDTEIHNGARLVFNGELTHDEGSLPFPLKGKYGMIDTLGNIIVPVEFDNYNVYFDQNPTFTIFNNGNEEKEFIKEVQIIDYYNDYGEPITQIALDTKYIYTQERGFKIFANNKLSDEYENIKILEYDPSYYSEYGAEQYFYKQIVEDTTNQILLSKFDNSMITNSFGTEIDYEKFDFINENIRSIDNNHRFKALSSPELFFIVKKNGKWGVVNANFEVVIPTIYKNVNSTTHNDKFCFIVNAGEQILFINTKGEIIK